MCVCVCVVVGKCVHVLMCCVCAQAQGCDTQLHVAGCVCGCVPQVHCVWACVHWRVCACGDVCRCCSAGDYAPVPWGNVVWPRYVHVCPAPVLRWKGCVCGGVGNRVGIYNLHTSIWGYRVWQQIFIVPHCVQGSEELSGRG